MRPTLAARGNQMNGPIVRCAADYRAANPDCKSASRRISVGQTSNAQPPGLHSPARAAAAVAARRHGRSKKVAMILADLRRMRLSRGLL
jgi:hypothetical protein